MSTPDCRAMLERGNHGGTPLNQARGWMATTAPVTGSLFMRVPGRGVRIDLKSSAPTELPSYSDLVVVGASLRVHARAAIQLHRIVTIHRKSAG